MSRRLTYRLNQWFYLTGWLPRVCTNTALVHSPPVEGWQAQPDGVVAAVLHNVTPIDLLAQSAVQFCPSVPTIKFFIFCW